MKSKRSTYLCVFLLSMCCAEPTEVEIGAAGPVEPNAHNDDDDQQPQHGVDHSYPMQYRNKPFGSQAMVYQKFLEGCFEAYSESHCLDSEKNRLELNLHQPRHMTNFTSAGYAKVKAPPPVMAILRKFWEDHTTNAWELEQESWPAGNTYVNHWDSPTEILRLQGRNGLSRTDLKVIEGQVGNMISDWIGGVELHATSTYGIRSYTEGSILSPHVDRLPLVASAIINIDQDVEEPWPLEVIDHSGRAVNVTIEPGDMILYESHSVIHGRPYPLRGEHYANVFVHFEPVGYTKWLAREVNNDFQADAKRLFDAALLKSFEDEGPTDPPTTLKLPPYLKAGTEEASRWQQEFVFERKEPPKRQATATQISGRTEGARDAHVLAANGSVESLQKVVANDPESLDAPDSNGWRPLHEAARSGNTKVVEYLLNEGADVNARTNQGRGATALWWAKHSLKENHEVIKLLEGKGGKATGPNSNL